MPVRSAVYGGIAPEEDPIQKGQRGRVNKISGEIRPVITICQWQHLLVVLSCPIAIALWFIVRQGTKGFSPLFHYDPPILPM